MAISRARFDHGHLGVIHHVADEPLAPSGNDQIDLPSHRKQDVHHGAVGILHKIDGVLQMEGCKSSFHHLYKGGVGEKRLLAPL